MTEKNIALIKKIYSIVIITLTIILALLCIIQIIDIYQNGKIAGNEFTYTPEIIWEHFKNIALVLTIWIISLIAGYVFYLIFPSKEKINAKIENKDLVEKMSTALPDDLSSYQEELTIINKEKKARHISFWITLSIVIILSIVCAIYFFNGENFSNDGNLMNEAGKMVLWLLPWICIMFGVLLVAKIHENHSYKVELSAIRTIITSSPDKKPVRIVHPKGPSQRTIIITRSIVLVVSITFIIIGIINGGAYDVLAKAIQICTECIGLG